MRRRAKYRHASAAPLAGLVSFATAPLHFTATSQAAFPFHSFRRSQTAETGTDRGAPGSSRFQRPRCSAYRPVSNMAARLRLSPKTAAIIAVTIQLSRRSAGCACETGRHRWKTDLSDTSPPGCGQVGRARPCCHRVADHALRSAVEESDTWLRAGATRRDCCGHDAS